MGLGLRATCHALHGHSRRSALLLAVLFVCAVHGDVVVQPRIVAIEDIVTARPGRERISPVTFTVSGLRFLDTSSYACFWSTPWTNRTRLRTAVRGRQLLCTLGAGHPLKKWHMAGLWPLVDWGKEGTMGGSARLTVRRPGANSKWWAESHTVVEVPVFFVRWPRLEPGEPAALTEEKRKLSVRFQDYIRRKQNPPDCWAASVVLLQRLQPTGLGSQLMMVARHLFEVVHNNSVFIPAFEWNYAEGLAPPVWSQIFRPLSHCETVLLENALPRRDFKHPNISPFMTKAKFHDFQTSPPPNWDQQLPQEFTHYGWGWVYGQLLRYIMKPSDRMMAYVGPAQEQLRKDAGGKELVCLYMRQGERGTGARSIPFGPFPMQKWHPDDLFDLLQQRALPKFPHAAWLVVSDTVALKQGIIREAQRTGLRIFTSLDLNMTRPKDGQDCLREKHLIQCSASVSRDAVRFFILVDLMLMTRCNHFIGTLSSTFARAALYHSYGRGLNKTVAFSVE